jgi:anaerobic dimethyl sulfoxide reductase subunit C (anchor subunit)
MSIEWALVFFTLFICLSVGTFLGAVVATEWWGKAAQVRLPGAIVTLVTLGVGGFSSVLHLGHPERLFGALGHPTSGIFAESTMIGLFGLDVLIYLWAMRKGLPDQTRRRIATVGTLPAVMLAFAVGDTYVLSSRPAWDTLILPTLYVVSAAVMGCFSLSLLVAHSKSADAATETAPVVDLATLVALAVQGVLLIAYLVHLAIAPYPDETRSATRVLAGNLAPLFWIGLVLIGLLIPFVLTTKFRTKISANLSSLASAKLGLICVLVAGVAFRVLMFSLGSSIRHFF